MENKILGIDLRKMSDGVLQLISSLTYNFILIEEEQIKDIMNIPSKMKLLVKMNAFTEMPFSDQVIVLSEKLEVLLDAREKGYECALYSFIDDEESMETTWKNARTIPYLVVEFKDETNIPLELLLARLQNTSTKILKIVDSVQDAVIAMKIMEKGSDGVILNTYDKKEIVQMNTYIENLKVGTVDLVTAEVIGVAHIEMGYRACIDTTDLLSKTEGMLIGSTSQGGILVSSETHYLPYMNTRPFRVNAGAVHSYLFQENDETNYISELKSGDTVMVVDICGNIRPVSLGRVKMEKRPLLKITAKADERIINAIVQDDWHIRIFGEEGRLLNVSSIKIGDYVLAYLCQGGRHVGIRIDETLIEV